MSEGVSWTAVVASLVFDWVGPRKRLSGIRYASSQGDYLGQRGERSSFTNEMQLMDSPASVLQIFEETRNQCLHCLCCSESQ